MRDYVKLAVLLAAIPAIGLARADALSDLLDASTVVQHAFYTRDSNTMLSARTDLERLAEAGSLGALAHYYTGYADFRLGQLALRDDKGAASELLDRCIEESKSSWKLNKRFAEAYALMSACYGFKAGLQPWKAVYYTPQAGRMMKKARELDGQNPRVVLLDAIAEYHLPRTLGGDKERAEERFTEAVQLFESDEAEVVRGYPDWGHAEAYAYMGEISLDRSDPIAARDAVEQALLIAPDYEWALEMLREVRAGN